MDIILNVALFCVVGNMAEKDTPKLYEADNGLFCQLCDEGHYLKKACETDNGLSTCQPCPADEFMDQKSSYTTCAQCSRCPNGQETIAKCSSVSDTVCQCPEGSFWHSILGYDGRCYPHKVCKGGLVVVAEGTPWTDTICGSKDIYSTGIIRTDNRVEEPDHKTQGTTTTVSTQDSGGFPTQDDDGFPRQADDEDGVVYVVIWVVFSVVIVGYCAFLICYWATRQESSL